MRHFCFVNTDQTGKYKKVMEASTYTCIQLKRHLCVTKMTLIFGLCFFVKHKKNNDDDNLLKHIYVYVNRI